MRHFARFLVVPGVALVLGGVGALTLRGSVERPAGAPAEA